MLKLGHVIRQWLRSLRPRPLAEPRPSLRALELISRVPPPPTPPRALEPVRPVPPPLPLSLIREGNDADYPSRVDADHYLSRMVAELRRLTLESPEVWNHAAAVADRLDGHGLEDLDRACFNSMLGELQCAQEEARYTVCNWVATLAGARSYAEAVDAWLRKNRP